MVPRRLPPRSLLRRKKRKRKKRTKRKKKKKKMKMKKHKNPKRVILSLTNPHVQRRKLLAK